MIENDLVECVIGLGPNLFYNSSMVSCLLICRVDKPEDRKGKTLFIQAVDEIRKETTMSYLDEHHIQKILTAYQNFENVDGFCEVVDKESILKDKVARLSVQYFVKSKNQTETVPFETLFHNWEQSSNELQNSMTSLFESLDND
jgi:type I restriction enzyme M protein